MTRVLRDGVRRAWPLLRLGAGALVIVVLVWRFGTGPLTDAWRVTSWPSVAAALVVNAATTMACAWRWRVVARALGAPLSVSGSVTAYYRSQALNTVLPGGIVGDAHRGLRHGRAAGDVGVGLRATVWDRVSGQLVQVPVLLLALALAGSRLGPWTSYAVPVALVLAAGAWALARRAGALTARAGADLRDLLPPSVAGRIIVASGLSTLGHVTVFLVAAHEVGVEASPALLVTVALVVLVGSAVPLNVAGWGPREGVTAWAFAAAGLGSATGLAVSIGYGVLAAVATAPGVVVLLADGARHRARRATSRPAPELEEALHG